jgi:hypothetical protein
MSQRKKYLSGAFVIFLILAAGYVFQFGLYPRYFDIEWDEDVQLHDGRVIVVHRKTTYERLQTGVTPYGGLIISRDTTLGFDAGGKTGRVTQLFKGFHPMFLGEDAGEWYAVLYGGYYYGSRELPGQDWGELEGPYGQWAIKLVDGKWTPISMRSLPSQFQRPNVLMLYGKASEHARFNGQRVTLQEKQSWLTKHPPGYAHVQLTRPTRASLPRKDAPTRSSRKETR